MMQFLNPFAIVLVLLPCISFAQESEQDAQQPSRAELLELTKPGTEHAELKRLVGNWEVVMTARGNDMGVGKAKSEMILGDRFLVLDGELLAGQQANQFRFTLGFDRRNSEYEVTLMDNAGTYSVSARGKRNEDTIRMTGMDNDPFMKQMGIDKKFAFDVKISDANNFEITTIYVDNRTKDEKFIPAFGYRFRRSETP